MNIYTKTFISTLLANSALIAAPTGVPVAIPTINCSSLNLPTNSGEGTLPMWTMQGCSTTTVPTNVSSGGGSTPPTTTTTTTTTFATDSDGSTYGGQVVVVNDAKTTTNSDGSTTTTLQSTATDGSKNTTVIAIPNSDDSQDRYTITTTHEDSVTETTSTTKVTLSKNANTTLNKDGSYKSSFALDGGVDVEISVDKDGEIVLSVSKNLGDGEVAKATITLPKGTTLDASDTQTDATTIGISADDGGNTFKSAELDVEANYGNRDMKVSATITNSDGTTKVVSMHSKSFALEEIINLIKTKTSDLRAIEEGEVYTGIVSEFGFEGSSFNLPDDENIKATIYSGSSNQTYQDKQYFDGKRTITLLSGTASIERDGELVEMLPGEEYLIGEIYENGETTEDIVVVLTSGGSYTIDGYWYFLGGDVWNWIYCLESSKGCYALKGFDNEKKEFIYDTKNVLAEPERAYDGYSIRFGTGAWDYTYSSREILNSLYTLQADGDGFSWGNSLGEYINTTISGEVVTFQRR